MSKNETKEKVDPLLNLGTFKDNSPHNPHLKTYTAGEDGSRLAAAARELGLAQARRPRVQIRRRKLLRKHSFRRPGDVLNLLLEKNTEDARMRAIFTSHDELTDNEMQMYHLSMPETEFETVVEGEEGEEPIDDGHGGGMGGDLVSAALGIIKAMVGPAILYLPHGFAGAGYVVAIPIMCFTTFLFLYSAGCLLDAWKSEHNKDHGIMPEGSSENTALLGGEQEPRKKSPQGLSYPELAYRALGPTGESLVKLGIALMQSGVCLTYLIFVPQNFHTSWLLITGMDVKPSIFLMVMIILEIPLSWIRDIRKLTPTNLLANTLILYGLLVCLGFAITESATGDEPGPVRNIWEHMDNLSPIASNWFLFIGTCVLLFEGTITLLVPIQEAIDTEEEREQFPKVFQRTIISIICFYMFFGITCWMAFGDSVRTVMTTSLPRGIMATTVQLAYSVAVIFTFPLQNFPALEITTRSISRAVKNRCLPSDTTQQTQQNKPWYVQRNFISSCLVALLAVVAVYTMESLDKVVSLMGSLLGCPIAFVFPPMIHSRLNKDTISPARLLGNRIVACLGVIAMVLASMVTLLTWK